MKKIHPFFKVRKGFQVLCLWIKFPVFYRPAVVRNHRIPEMDTALLVKKSQFSLIHFIGCINVLHEMENIRLAVSKWGKCRSYGNDLAQYR